MGAQWYVWSQNKKRWDTTAAPATAVVEEKRPSAADETPVETEEPTVVVEDTTESAETAGDEPESPPVKVVAPPKRDDLPKNAPIQDLEGHSGMSLSGSEKDPVEFPGGALPDTFVEQVFGYLDTAAMLALRAASPWLLEHGSERTARPPAQADQGPPQGPRRRVAEARMSALKTRPLVDQYRDAIKHRPPEKLVVASDKVNAHTIATLTGGMPKTALTVHYGERTDTGAPGPSLRAR